MNYKDKTFEIDNTQIRFTNIFNRVLPALVSSLVVFGIIGIKHDVISVLLRVFGAGLGYIIAFGIFIRVYWKNTIDLHDISQVKIVTWDNSIDKDRNFWGRPKYKYYFPAGLNKKSSQKIIFVEKLNSKLAVGFVPESFENAIEVFKEKGIRIVEKL
ncbi:MAG: hypothetical protein ACHQIM_17875 [Sphingobacteriales bacterium]